MAGVSNFKLTDENNNAKGHPTLMECADVMTAKGMDDEWQLLNFGGHVEARIRVDHDPSVDNLVFIGKQGFRYVDNDPDDNPNKYFTVTKDGKILDESSSERTIVRNYLQRREYMDSIEPDSAIELAQFIQNGSFSKDFDTLVSTIKDDLEGDSYRLHETLESAKIMVIAASAQYNADYGTKGEDLFSVATINQAVMSVVMEAEKETGFSPTIAKSMAAVQGTGQNIDAKSNKRFQR
jgi:hypothetical protein